MLLKAARATLKQGTTDVVEADAVHSVVYDVPLTGSAAPHKMGAADVKAWGQTDLPTDATAVFPPDSVPSSNSGSALAAGDYRRASVHYLSASARKVNTAAPGGHISTTEYDRFGNTVRELSAANRALALGLSADATAVQADLGIGSLPSAERAELLSTRSVHNSTGTRELEGFGPLHRVTLTQDLKSGTATLVAAGTSVTARAWTVAEYDTGRPTDRSATIADQVTKRTVGAQVREHPSVHAERRVSETVYDWAKGLPLKEIQDPAGLAITTTTEYDSQGRETKNIAPGGTGTDAATTVTTYWSATGTPAPAPVPAGRSGPTWCAPPAPPVPSPAAEAIPPSAPPGPPSTTGGVTPRRSRRWRTERPAPSPTPMTRLAGPPRSRLRIPRDRPSPMSPPSTTPPPDAR
ncbi:hypothetical protein GCM10010393_15700 [Streptomyces gobitricini]|uniref:YD repeat-containing protein n=1 Tax=Streptomyces gobitricini TaxID=68211 RepID=A0ABN3LP55_9ACTN